MGSRDRLLFGLLVAVVVVLTLLSGGQARSEAARMRPSSFLSSPGGTRALFLALPALGVPTGRRLTPYVGPEPLAGPLVLLAPSESPTPSELHALARWVRAGGTLVYAAVPGDATLDTLGLRLALVAAPGRGGWKSAAARALPHPLTRGVAEVPGFRFAFAPSSPLLRAGAAERLLVMNDGRVAALRARLGSGSVVALSDPAPLGNGVVRRSGAAPIVARAVAGGGRVIFDEYHQGYRTGGSATGALLRFLRRTPPGHLALQLAAAALGLLLLAGRRFGAPRPPAPARRRYPLEHVVALGEAYRQTEARRTARRLLLSGTAAPAGAARAPEGREERRWTIAPLRARRPAGERRGAGGGVEKGRPYRPRGGGAPRGPTAQRDGTRRAEWTERRSCCTPVPARGRWWRHWRGSCSGRRRCSARCWWPSSPAATPCWRGCRAPPRRSPSARSRCALDLRFGRVQFTPDLMPTDLMGVNVLDG